MSIFRPAEMAVLLLAALAGWVLILGDNAIGFALVLASEAWSFGRVTRYQLAARPEAPLRHRRDLWVLWSLFLLELSGALVWPTSHLSGIALLLGGEIAAAAWAMERCLLPLETG